MTPSRWLFLTTLATAVGITVVYPERAIIVHIGAVVCLLLALLVIRADFKKKFIIVLLLCCAGIRTTSFLHIPNLSGPQEGYVVVNNISQKDSGNYQLIVTFSAGQRISLQTSETAEIGDKLLVKCASISRNLLTPKILRRDRLSGTCDQAKVLKRLPGNSLNPFRMLAKAHQAFSQSVQHALPAAEAILGVGMVIGGTTGMDPNLTNAFRRAGLSHLVAVSGANLSLVLAAVVVLLSGRLPPRVRILGIVLLTFCFVVLTGAEASIVRAGIMAILALIVSLSGRISGGINILSASALIMLWANPSLLWDNLGFALSFSATFGLVAFAPRLEELLRRVSPSGIATATAATLGATFSTLPVLLIAFQQASIVSPFANLIVVPLVPWIMALVSIVGVVGLFFPILAAIPAIFAWIFLRIITFVAETANRLPLASVILSPEIAIAVSFGLIFLIFYLFRKYVRPHLD
jgi:ComEC/Rec2-related protein